MIGSDNERIQGRVGKTNKTVIYAGRPTFPSIEKFTMTNSFLELVLRLLLLSRLISFRSVLRLLPCLRAFGPSFCLGTSSKRKENLTFLPLTSELSLVKSNVFFSGRVNGRAGGGGTTAVAVLCLRRNKSSKSSASRDDDEKKRKFSQRYVINCLLVAEHHKNETVIFLTYFFRFPSSTS